VPRQRIDRAGDAQPQCLAMNFSALSQPSRLVDLCLKYLYCRFPVGDSIGRDDYLVTLIFSSGNLHKIDTKLTLLYTTNRPIFQVYLQLLEMFSTKA
jgi:hypothetical protein